MKTFLNVAIQSLKRVSVSRQIVLLFFILSGQSLWAVSICPLSKESASVVSEGENVLLQQISQNPTYFTGLLVELADGTSTLALGPYMGSGHIGLFQSLSESFSDSMSIQKILWAGEVFVEQRDGQVQLLDANVTSGFIFSEQNQRQMIDQSISLENNYQALLQKVVEKGWNTNKAPQSVEFDPGREHLMSEMNALGKNLRHTIYTAFNNIIPHLEMTSLGISLSEDDESIKALRREYLNILKSGVEMALQTSGYSYSGSETALLNKVLEVISAEAHQFWGWDGQKLAKERAAELHQVFFKASKLFTEGPSVPYVISIL